VSKKIGLPDSMSSIKNAIGYGTSFEAGETFRRIV
jgi:hypothetical protein